MAVDALIAMFDELMNVSIADGTIEQRLSKTPVDWEMTPVSLAKEPGVPLKDAFTSELWEQIRISAQELKSGDVPKADSSFMARQRAAMEAKEALISCARLATCSSLKRFGLQQPT